MPDKQLQSAWETLNTHVKQLKAIVREQENTIKKLRQDRKKYETYIIEKIKDKNDFITDSNVKLKIEVL